MLPPQLPQFLEVLLVVFAIAGTMWVLEAMGDVPGLYDRFIGSGMGSISFLQMIYFAFITISTVGYGDFSPSTALSRCFILVAVVVGVMFFSYLSSRILDLLKLEATGLGRYRASAKHTGDGRGHILVMGGGVSCGSVTVLETFLKALCRPGCPEIVLLSQTGCSDGVRDLLAGPGANEFSIKYRQSLTPSRKKLAEFAGEKEGCRQREGERGGRAKEDGSIVLKQHIASTASCPLRVQSLPSSLSLCPLPLTTTGTSWGRHWTRAISSASRPPRPQ